MKKIAELQGKVQITEKGTADQKEQQNLLLNSIVQNGILNNRGVTVAL